MEKIVIIGAGQAAAQTIYTLRKEGFDGELTLVGDEPQLPYQRPPLSKKYLAGEILDDSLLFRHQAFYDSHAVQLRIGVSAERILTMERKILLSSGESVSYDQLLLSVGAQPRPLSCPGADLPGIHYLRGLADVLSLRPNLTPSSRVLIVGGGYIGLETAATARKLGCSVTVL